MLSNIDLNKYINDYYSLFYKYKKVKYKRRKISLGLYIFRIIYIYKYIIN